MRNRRLFLGLGMALAGGAEFLVFVSSETGRHAPTLRLVLAGLCVAIVSLIVAAIASGDSAFSVDSRLRIPVLVLSSMCLQLVGSTIVLLVPGMHPLTRGLELVTGLGAIVLAAASCWQLRRARGSWPPLEAKST